MGRNPHLPDLSMQESSRSLSPGDTSRSGRAVATMSKIAQKLNERTDWSSFRDITGSSIDVGNAIHVLLNARYAASAEAAYWRLENRIVVQGTVYSAVVPATCVLVAALADDIPMPVTISILELLYQILSGAQAEDETGVDLIGQCRVLASEGLWLIVKEFVDGPRDAARDVLQYLNTDVDFEMLVLSDL